MTDTIPLDEARKGICNMRIGRYREIKLALHLPGLGLWHWVKMIRFKGSQ